MVEYDDHSLHIKLSYYASPEDIRNVILLHHHISVCIDRNILTMIVTPYEMFIFRRKSSTSFTSFLQSSKAFSRLARATFAALAAHSPCVTPS